MQYRIEGQNRHIEKKGLTPRKELGLSNEFYRHQLEAAEQAHQERDQASKDNKNSELKQRKFESTAELETYLSRQMDNLQAKQDTQNTGKSLEALATARKMAHLTDWTDRGQRLTQADLNQILQEQKALNKQVNSNELVRQKTAAKSTIDISPKNNWPQETENRVQDKIQIDKNSANLHREVEHKLQKEIIQYTDRLKSLKKIDKEKLKEQIKESLKKEREQERKQRMKKTAENAQHQEWATDQTNLANQFGTDKKSDDGGDSNSSNLQTQLDKLQTQLAEASVAHLPTDTIQQHIDQIKQKIEAEKGTHSDAQSLRAKL